MRQAIVTYFPPTDFNEPEGGGISMSTFNKVKNLLANNITVDIISFVEIANTPDNLSYVNLNDRLLTFINKRRSSYFFRLISYIYKAILVRRYFKKNYLKYNDIQIDDCEGLALFVPPKIKYTLRIHGNYFLFGSLAFKNKFWGKVFTLIDFMSIAKADFVSVPSRFCKRILDTKLKGKSPQISVVLNAPFNFPKKDIIYKNTISFIITDRLDQIKGGEFILNSIDKLISEYNGFYDLKFIIVGENRLGNYISHALLKHTNRKIQIEFTGHLNHKKVIDKMYYADFFIAASNFETYSYTFFEAMNLGLPLILPKKHVYLEFAHGIAFYFKYNIQNSLIEQIYKAIDTYNCKEIDYYSDNVNSRFKLIYNNLYSSE